MNRGNLLLVIGLVLALALAGFFLLSEQTERFEGRPGAEPATTGRTGGQPPRARRPPWPLPRPAAPFTKEYAKVSPGPPPARVAVQLARLPREARVEIAMTA